MLNYGQADRRCFNKKSHKNTPIFFLRDDQMRENGAPFFFACVRRKLLRTQKMACFAARHLPRGDCCAKRVFDQDVARAQQRNG